MTVPKGYQDCRMLVLKAGVPEKCSGLKRLYCCEEGQCAFYRSASEPGPTNRYKAKKKAGKPQK